MKHLKHVFTTNHAWRVKSCDGFSLVELIVAVAILGVLAGISAPSLGDWLSDSKLELVASDVRNAVAKSRSESIATAQNVRLEISNDSLISCISSDVTKACSTVSVDDVLRELSWDSTQFSVGRNSTLEAPIIVDPRGRIRPIQDIIAITFCDYRGVNKGLVLSISQVGRTNLEKLGNEEDTQCL